MHSSTGARPILTLQFALCSMVPDCVGSLPAGNDPRNQ